jgi:hypothetical protein
VPGKVVQLSPALAKLTEVGFLMVVRKAMGMMLTDVSGLSLAKGLGVYTESSEMLTGAVCGKPLLAAHGTVDGVLSYVLSVRGPRVWRYVFTDPSKWQCCWRLRGQTQREPQGWRR